MFGSLRLALTRPMSLGRTNLRIESWRVYSSAAPPLTPESVTERVIRVVQQFDKVDPAKVSKNSHFIKDLGLDSLDAVERVMALEDEFCVDVPESNLESFVSVEAAISHILATPHAK